MNDTNETKAMVVNTEDETQYFFANISNVERENLEPTEWLNQSRYWRYNTEYGILLNQVTTTDRAGTWELRCDNAQFNRAKAELPHIRDFVGKDLLDSLAK